MLLHTTLFLQSVCLDSLGLLKEQDKGLWDYSTPSHFLDHEEYSNCQKFLLTHWSFIISSFFFSSGLLWGPTGTLYLLAKQCAADTTQQVWTRLPPQKLSPIYIAAVQGWDPGRDEDPPTILGLTKLLFLCLLPHGLVVPAELPTTSGTGGLLSLLAEIKRDMESDYQNLYVFKLITMSRAYSGCRPLFANRGPLPSLDL